MLQYHLRIVVGPDEEKTNELRNIEKQNVGKSYIDHKVLHWLRNKLENPHIYHLKVGWVCGVSLITRKEKSQQKMFPLVDPVIDDLIVV